MKKSQLKELVRNIVKEVANPPQSDLKTQAFQELDKMSKELAKYKPGTKEHIQLSDQYIKLWWQARKFLNLGPLKENQYQRDFDRLMNDKFKEFLEQHEGYQKTFAQAYKVGFRDGYNSAKEGY